MSAQVWGVILAGLFGLVAAVYTALKNSQTSSQASTVAEAASQREFQLAFLKTLQDEIMKLNAQRADLQAELATTQTNADLERTHRRAVESKLDALTETLERLQIILKLIPAAVENPEIQRFLQADFHS